MDSMNSFFIDSSLLDSLLYKPFNCPNRYTFFENNILSFINNRIHSFIIDFNTAKNPQAKNLLSL